MASGFPRWNRFLLHIIILTDWRLLKWLKYGKKLQHLSSGSCRRASVLCSSFSLPPLVLSCFPKVYYSSRSAGKLGTCWWGDAIFVATWAPVFGFCFGSEVSARSHTAVGCPGLCIAPAWLVGTGWILCWAQRRGEEQSSCVCPFGKENVSVVPSVLQRRETQCELFGKGRKYVQNPGKKMDVKIRCWKLLGAWITPEQTKNNKTKSKKHQKENCLKRGGPMQRSLDFLPFLPHLLSRVCSLFHLDPTQESKTAI